MAAAGIAGIAVVLACIVLYYVKSRNKNRTSNSISCLPTRNDQLIEKFMGTHEHLASKQFEFSEIKKITNNFAEILGQGGYGQVYKGQLTDGREVAVKVLNGSRGNGNDFINEVASISRTSHVNIVTLIGFCYGRKKRALVYEFMPNGSLDKFICRHGTVDSNPHLEWQMLYQIAVGIARGLEYLHRGCNTRIVHFDIKPHNILLDKDFSPKISDFGLAKWSKKKESVLSMTEARGTIGYIAPEVFCRNFGGVSHKSDVYSYGMMVLEMVGVRDRGIAGLSQSESGEAYFPHWIYEYLEQGKDLRLQGVISEEERDLATKMILVGLWCIQTNPSDRPSINKVVEMLYGSIQSLEIPPNPFFFPPRRSPQASYSSSLT